MLTVNLHLKRLEATTRHESIYNINLEVTYLYSFPYKRQASLLLAFAAA